jgi:hypothetical protein
MSESKLFKIFFYVIHQMPARRDVNLNTSFFKEKSLVNDHGLEDYKEFTFFFIFKCKSCNEKI